LYYIILYYIIIGKDTISFMQGIYIYIPETNHVPKEYSVAAILSLLFVVPISLAPALAVMYFYICTFRSMCAVPNMAVFCSSLTSWFPGIVLTYYLNDFEMYYYLYYYYYYRNASMSAVNSINCPSAIRLSAANLVYKDAHNVTVPSIRPTSTLTDLCVRYGALKAALQRHSVIFVVFILCM
jgi:hypothetical protein